MPDPTDTPTMIHFRAPGTSGTACGQTEHVTRTDTYPGAVTCFACRKSPGFRTWEGVGVPTPQRQTPKLLRDIMAESTEMRDILKAGLNSGTGDGQWAALTDLADHFGLTYNEDTDTYS